MRWVIIFLSLLGFSASCEDENQKELMAIVPGIYKGQFIRTSPYAKYAPSDVTLEFTSNRFSGQSEVTNFPAICSGTFSVEGTEISFENECFFTADFDWTLILNGTYQLKVTGSKLEMTRVQNEITDKYIPTLQ
jgi:hypothetical protein